MHRKRPSGETRNSPETRSGTGTSSILLLAVLMILLSAWHSPPGSVDAADTPQRLCFEAEHVTSLRYPFVIGKATKASGKLALKVPEGAGSWKAFNEEDTRMAKYHVALPSAGKWQVWIRAKWHGPCSNSVFVRSRDGKTHKVASKRMDQWHWVSGGRHEIEKRNATLELLNREDGVAIDQILLSKTQEPPTGIATMNLIPGRDRKPVVPRLFLGINANSMSSTDFPLTHGNTRSLPLKPIPRLILQRGQTTHLSGWIRNSTAHNESYVVALKTSAPVKITPGINQKLELTKEQPLRKVDFRIKPAQNMPRTTHRLAVQFQHPGGRIDVHKMFLERPFQWLVTRAFKCPKSLGLDAPPHLNKQFEDGFPEQTEDVSWKVAPPKSITPFGLVDMREAVRNDTYVMAYAYTQLRSPHTGDFLMQVRHDDMIRVWLNGKKVFTSLQTLPSALTRKLVKIQLKKGINHVLVKICQRKNYWEFGLRIHDLKDRLTDVEGVSVRGLIE